MNPQLSARELELICSVFVLHPEITGAILYGSRAKGTAHPASDVDIALEGIADPLAAEAIASELDELPLPYQFDVQAFAAIRSRLLRAHIHRVGIRIHG